MCTVYELCCIVVAFLFLKHSCFWNVFLVSRMASWWTTSNSKSSSIYTSARKSIWRRRMWIRMFPRCIRRRVDGCGQRLNFNPTFFFCLVLLVYFVSVSGSCCYALVRTHAPTRMRVCILGCLLACVRKCVRASDLTVAYVFYFPLFFAMLFVCDVSFCLLSSSTHPFVINTVFWGVCFSWWAFRPPTN